MCTKRILHISHTDINFDSRILKEMIALSECGKKYSLYGLGVKMDEGNIISAQSRSLKIDCIQLRIRNFKWLPVFLRHVLTLIELTFKMVIKAKKIRPNIIHAHDTLVLPLGVLLKFITGAHLIYDAHELESNRNGLTPLLSKLTLMTERILWRYLNYLIVVSPSIQKWYENNLGDKPSEVILNSPVLYLAGGENELFDDNYLRRKYSITANEKIFTYVGIFGKGRGIESLIDVFSGLRGAHIVFIGYGELTNLIEKSMAFHGNIHLHPAVPHENVVDIIRSADVGLCMIGNVSLSDYYCLPNKLFEYCFAKKPVIASNFPDIKNVVNKYNLGVCCEDDKESIKRTVELFIHNMADADIDIENLIDLSWETQTDKLYEVYKYVSIS